MTEWKAKRFWTEATVAEADGGFKVLLDGRGVNTPGKLPLVMPTRAMALAVAAEWNAQEGEIAPLTMPHTRSANSAIERVTPQLADVSDMLLGYAETDLLCYRAEGPDALTQRQAAEWDPMLDWGAEALDARLEPRTGVMWVSQEPTAIKALDTDLRQIGPFPMTALHDLVTLTGSLILGLAVARGRISAKEAWRLSRIDETWQMEQWGADEEAEDAAAIKEAQLRHAEAFWDLCFDK
ncbi:ATP12 family chaperone protein [Jannaschia sp. CCS1]|uniref:ATP12 family chaperone protein n=1 Tax=Jannaschia sp. (strain CCS1) TaxID=290400 RepID=UPI000053BBDB|nr:ATP12 family protein [Jannaschia sp. CCS1]ABD53543.1 ATP12 ATPase [Jannaschia sp. CCS1]